MTVYIGVDPGVTGAVAFYRPTDEELEVFDLPTRTITVGGTKRKRLDLLELSALVDFHTPPGAPVLIEEVNAFAQGGRTMGATSAFTFGFAAGVVEAMFTFAGATVQTMTPVVWKRMMKLNTDKALSRQRAAQAFPARAGLFARVKDDGRAEAALLAQLCYWLHKETP